MKELVGAVYALGIVATFLYLLVHDWPYTWWNWAILWPLDIPVAMGWPIYWIFFR